jgi:hypothetical protein
VLGLTLSISLSAPFYVSSFSADGRIRFTLETETTANGEVQLINRGLAGTGLQTYLGQETNESILTEECVCDSGVYAGSPKARVEIILK